MKSENEYIGDDKFAKMLQHYNCDLDINLIKFRFIGSICSPNADLRPTDIISSLWPANKQPRLETKKEAELFFKFFMGLWDAMFAKIMKNNVSLPPISTQKTLLESCQSRYDILESGFLEGFWGGKQNVEIPAFIAEIVDSLSQMASLYQTLAGKIPSDNNDNKAIKDAIADCDKMVNKSFNFIIVHYVLPHISELKRTIN